MFTAMVSGCLLVALGLFFESPVQAGTMAVTGGGISMTVDDTGGGAWAMSFGGNNVLGANLVHLNITELFSQDTPPTTDFVNDSSRTPSDWSTKAAGGAITAGPMLGTHTTTICTFTDTLNSQDIQQITFADPAGGADYVIVVFKFIHTWTNPYPDLYATLWVDYDANAVAANNIARSNTGGGNEVIRAFDTTGDNVGLVLLSGGPASNIEYNDVALTPMPHTTNVAEVAAITAPADPAPTDTGTAADFVIGVTGAVQAGMASAGDSFSIAFAFCAGSNQATLEIAADAAETAWTSVISPALTAGFPAPTVVSVTPNSGNVAGGENVNISGTSFFDGAGMPNVTDITFGCTSGTAITILSDTSLTVNTPVSGSTGGVDVIVTTTFGGGTGAGAFTYNSCAPTAPTITGISNPTPAQGTQDGGTVVTIDGTNFDCETPVVTFGGVSGTGVIVSSATQLTVVSPVFPSVQVVDVVISNTAGNDTLLAGWNYLASTGGGTGGTGAPNQAQLLGSSGGCSVYSKSQRGLPLAIVMFLTVLSYVVYRRTRRAATDR